MNHGFMTILPILAGGQSQANDPARRIGPLAVTFVDFLGQGGASFIWPECAMLVACQYMRVLAG
jgi:hypothetical protein